MHSPGDVTPQALKYNALPVIPNLEIDHTLSGHCDFTKPLGAHELATNYETIGNLKLYNANP